VSPGKKIKCIITEAAMAPHRSALAVFCIFFSGFLGFRLLCGAWECRALFNGVHPVTLSAVSKYGGCGGPFDLSGGGVPQRIVLTYSEWTPAASGRVDLWSRLNPGFDVVFFDNRGCLSFLLEHFGADVSLRFNSIKHGPIKSDFFRVHYLYAVGGVYCDLDSVPVAPLSSFIDFYSPRSVLYVAESRHAGQLNPMVMASTAGHVSLGAAVGVYARLSSARPFVYSYWTWSVVHVLSGLLHCGYPMNVTLYEHCGSDLYGCTIGGVNVSGCESLLLRVRGNDYDRYGHGFY